MSLDQSNRYQNPLDAFRTARVLRMESTMSIVPHAVPAHQKTYAVGSVA
jgi:hypothetical protein